MDLVDKDFEFMSSGSSSYIYSKIAKICIIDWEDVPLYNSKGKRVQAITEDGLQMLTVPSGDFENLPDSHVLELGQFIYLNCSTLSPDESMKYKGLIRFQYWFSHKRHRDRAKSFICKNCIESGQDLSRHCGKSSSFKEAMRIELGVDKNIETFEVQPRGRAVFSMSPPDKVVDKSLLRILDFEFPECPTSWIGPSIKNWTEKISFCVRNNMNFFKGSLESQPNKIYEIQALIQSESNYMEIRMQEVFKNG